MIVCSGGMHLPDEPRWIFYAEICRWRTEPSVADILLEGAVLGRYELLRPGLPGGHRWPRRCRRRRL
jgi:hypothetical protein